MRSVILLGAVLVVVTLATYWQVGTHEFVDFDDDIFITNNVHVLTGITKDNLLWAFAPVPDIGWFPLTWLSHMVDVELYGLNPRGHHLTNVAWHITATLLLFILLFRTTRTPWPSAFVAALFALHPLHVESVAWMAERRDVLSASFGFLALWLYAEYVMQHRRSFYLLALLAFVLGLMAKPMLVTLPLLMLLLDCWPLLRFGGQAQVPGQPQRFVVLSSLGPLVKEKIPFFACSLAAAVITLSVPPAAGPLQNEVIPLGLRIANAATAYLKYLGKMFWPTNLAIPYPFPPSIPLWQVIGSLLTLAIVTALVVWAGKRHPYLAVGWLWFLVTLVPVLGLVKIGGHSIADRYTYIPLTGIFIALAWGVPVLTQGLPRQRWLLAISAGLALTASTVLTWQQLRYWQNSIVLFQHALRATPANPVAHNNLGIAFKERGALAEATQHFRKALDLYPRNADAYNNLGLVLEEMGSYDEAMRNYQMAIRIDSNLAVAHNNLGNVLVKKMRVDEAISEYRKALDLDKNYFTAYNNLGNVLSWRGYYDEAIEEYLKSIRINPNNAETYNYLGVTYLKKNQLDEAMNCFRKAISINPNYLDAVNNFNYALQMTRRLDQPR